MAYKFINPRGKIHMKLDADYRMVEMANMEPISLKGKIRVWLLKNKVDLYTVENRMMKDILELGMGEEIDSFQYVDDIF